jgi:hypothetical protein
MSQTIGNFKSGFNGGTRANRFSVDITWPEGVGNLSPDTLEYHAIAAKLPEAELGSIAIPYRGRVAYFAGDREYKPWTVTILDDTGSNASWLAFHKWTNLLSDNETNKVDDPKYVNTHKSIIFKQLHDPTVSDSTGHEPIRVITLTNAWPSEVGQIALDMGEGGNLVSYSVTFSYDYYTITTGLQ